MSVAKIVILPQNKSITRFALLKFSE